MRHKTYATQVLSGVRATAQAIHTNAQAARAATESLEPSDIRIRQSSNTSKCSPLCHDHDLFAIVQFLVDGAIEAQFSAFAATAPLACGPLALLLRATGLTTAARWPGIKSDADALLQQPVNGSIEHHPHAIAILHF